VKYIVANWKMNHSADSARQFFTTAREALRLAKGVEIIVCPPYPLLSVIKSEVVGTPIKLGAQNLSQFSDGAYTGEVSGMQLAGLADYVIVGHSERKKYFKESIQEISAKVLAARKFELKPILCFERAEELSSAGSSEGLIVAYEPTFAIGSGNPDTPDNAADVAKRARSILKADVPVLYGGSVTAENVKSFLSRSEISGVLVGGASLDPIGFVNLVHAVSS